MGFSGSWELQWVDHVGFRALPLRKVERGGSPQQDCFLVSESLKALSHKTNPNTKTPSGRIALVKALPS